MTATHADDERTLAGFRQVDVMHSLEFVDDSLLTIRHEAHYVLEATRPERFFRRRFTWTGGGIEKSPELKSGRDSSGYQRQRVHGPLIREGEERLLLIDLGREFETGESVELGLRQTFIDVDASMEPRLGYLVQEGCNRVELRVAFPESLDVAVKRQTYDGSSTKPNEVAFIDPVAEEKEGGVRATYIWPIESPIRGRRYRIVWDVAD